MAFVAGQILTAAALNAIRTDGAWTSFVPSWTNFTPGNASVACAYFRSGNFVAVRLYLALGSTSVMGNSPIFTLPVTAAGATYGGGAIITYRDVSGPIDYEGIVRLAGTAQGYLLVRGVAGADDRRTHITSTVPFTWATGDIISGSFIYETA